MTSLNVRNRINDLYREAEEIMRRYVKGEVSREVSFKDVVSIHEEISSLKKRGECVCLACREARG